MNVVPVIALVSLLLLVNFLLWFLMDRRMTDMEERLERLQQGLTQ